MRILTEPQGAIASQYQALFGFQDVDLSFTDEALREVARRARERKTGARGLRAILEEVLLNTMYELPSRKDVTRCVIDREVVQKKVNPTLVPVKPAKRQRTEKSA